MSQPDATLSIRLLFECTGDVASRRDLSGEQMRALVRLLARQAAHDFVEQEQDSAGSFTDQ
ncbi:hypothetical protein ACLRDC_13170 [Gluconacetobacter sacchari]|uniref:hypothetical protein n=1 Tax=Gluconacetobacter sacchari TaxID=92759 RepID=UPI0039B4149F